MAYIGTETGDLTTEIVAPKIEIQWDSVKQDGQILFYTQRLMSLNGVPVAAQDLNHLMIVPVKELLPRSFKVEGQDAEGNYFAMDVPTTLMMGYIKACFDTLYEEKIVNYVPPTVAPGALPTEVPAAE
ncbi:hypothetical protein [Dyella sp. ASV21]|uniref:hypothetical protein n=1 Tax=Dyella sp. ASV21 TaxID=2795114 RepID=UPI0018EDAE6F|nr:hypothetical protein [Dyella sp. ASV21]